MTLPRKLLIRFSTIAETLPPAQRAGRSWLSAAERVELERLRDEPRRRQWLAGRWLSKRLIAQMADVADVGRIQIFSRDERVRGVRPRIVLDGRPLDWSLSISHTDRGVLAALVPTSQLLVGVDLANEVPSSAGFRRLWFSASERRWIDGDPQRHTAVGWAIKEAVYKAVNEGESWSPRDVEVLRQSNGDFDCTYRGNATRGLTVHLRNVEERGIEHHVVAIACLLRGGHENPVSSHTLGTAERWSGSERVNACS